LKIAANPLLQRTVDSGIDGVGKIVENGINGKAWNNELAETVAGNFLLGSAVDGLIKGSKALIPYKSTGVIAPVNKSRVQELLDKHLDYYFENIVGKDNINNVVNRNGVRGDINYAKSEINNHIRHQYTENITPSNSLNLLDPSSDKILTDFAKARSWIAEDEDFFNIFAHGSADSIYFKTSRGQMELTPENVKQILLKLDGYDGQSIRMFSCETGQEIDGFAQKLSTLMGVEVTAPTELLWGRRNGFLKLHQEDI
jgi:hypothetical protein